MANANRENDAKRQVVQYFTSRAEYWDWVYRGADVCSRVFQLRRKVILEMIDRLSLSKKAYILEVGCGSGVTTMELARRGYDVQAVDVVKKMIDLTLQHAAQADVSDRVFPSIGDAQSLHFTDDTFDLVLAIGVLPYFTSPSTALHEMARVMKPEGFLIITSDNYWRLDRLLDPDWSPLIRPLRHFVIRASNRPRYKLKRIPDYVYSIKELRAIVGSTQLRECRLATVGFGPFTFHGKKIPNLVGALFNEKLQQLADRDPTGPLSRLGSHHILLAQKRGFA